MQFLLGHVPGGHWPSLFRPALGLVQQSEDGLCEVVVVPGWKRTGVMGASRHMPRCTSIAARAIRVASLAPKRDDRFRQVIDLVRSYGLLNRPLLTPVCRTWKDADDVKRAIYRSARYYCGCSDHNCTRKNSRDCPSGDQRISCKADVVKDAEGKWRVQVLLRDKQDGRRFVIQKYGPDPSKWPYQAKARKLKES